MKIVWEGISYCSHNLCLDSANLSTIPQIPAQHTDSYSLVKKIRLKKRYISSCNKLNEYMYIHTSLA